MQISLSKLSALEKIKLLSSREIDLLNTEAVFSDETENFVSRAPIGDSVTVKLRTFLDNADSVFLCADGVPLAMAKVSPAPLFDFYETTLKAKTAFRYYFIISKNSRRYYYNRRGVFSDLNNDFDFQYRPGFDVPEWARGAVMYQIFVDRFYNGDPANDVVNNEYAYIGRAAKKMENWQTPVRADDICNFYGGDLLGVIKKLDYLEELGIDAIYFNPVFVSPSTHKYDIQDYDYVDPHYGVIIDDGGDPLYFEKFSNRYATMYMKRTTNKINLEASNELMCRLIALAHERGIKVIIDGVFNHCGAFNKWLDKENFYSGKGYPNGAYRDEKSPYHDYFLWYDRNWPNNDCYDAWWGHDNHPKLHYETSPELYQYIMDIGRKWVSPPFNADGWRLDVAADLGTSPDFNHKFWKDFRKAVKGANPNAIILAEHYGDPSAWLCGDEWDTIMNYDAFMEPLTWFLTGMEKHSEEFKPDMLCNTQSFVDAMRYHMAKLPLQSLECSMNELSNHDHSRFLTRTNRTAGRLHTLGTEAAGEGINKDVMMEAVLFQMTWPGCPTVYYGDEAGLVGWTDPDDRRPYPWGNEDKNMIAFHRAAIAMRKKYGVFKSGSVEYLNGDYGVLSFGRWNKDSAAFVALNNNNSPRLLTVPVWKAGVTGGAFSRVMHTFNGGFDLKKETAEVVNGCVTLMMMPYSGAVFVK